MTIKYIFKITTNNIKKSKSGFKSSSNGLLLYHSEQAISTSQRLCYFITSALLTALGGEGTLRRNPVKVNNHYPIEDF